MTRTVPLEYCITDFAHVTRETIKPTASLFCQTPEERQTD